jgi:hypothetical protein
MISHHAQVKVIGINGQVSLGKEFAGKMVVVEQVEKGTWIIKCGEFIPDSEKWLHQSGNIEKIDKALDWAAKNHPLDNFNEIISGIENDADHKN